MARSTVHYADNKTNSILKALHNKLRPAGTPVQRVEYIIELLLLRIFEVKVKRDSEFKPLRDLFINNDNALVFSDLTPLNGDQALIALNKKVFPFYGSILGKARGVYKNKNLPQKVQDQLVLIEEVFSNSSFSNNVKNGNLNEVLGLGSDIDEEGLLKTDLLGDAIESALSEQGGTKDVGLYRTPDHLRQMMVVMADPDFRDTILDPACGTGGFLFDAFQYVMEKVGKDNKWPGNKSHKEIKQYLEKYLKHIETEMPSNNVANTFYRIGISGVEYLGMIRKMAAINLYIRGLNPANIEQGDSLELYNPNAEANGKSVVIANPPFGAKLDQPAYPNVWEEYPKTDSTTLFVKLMFNHLKNGGRCAVVVSEGFLTWDSEAAKEMRKLLLEEANLKAIISLPQGLFVSKGGQGAKTSILYFEKGEPTKNVWFYKITNDGYSMGVNRKETPGCQIPEALELFTKYVKYGKTPPKTKNSFIIPVEWIKQIDPRLKGRIAAETTEQQKIKFNEKRGKEIGKLDEKLKKGKITEKEYKEKIFQFDNVVENNIQNEIARRVEKAHSYSFNLQNYKSILSDDQTKKWQAAFKGIKIKNGANIDARYQELLQADSKTALQILASFNFESALEMDIEREYLSKIEKKDKKMLELEEILKEAQKYSKASLGILLKPKNNKIKIEKDKIYREITLKLYGKGIRERRTVKGEEISFNECYSLEEDDIVTSIHQFRNGCFVRIPKNFEGYVVSKNFLVYEIDKNLINPKYLEYIVTSNNQIKKYQAGSQGGATPIFPREDILKVEVPLPSLEIQQEIVEKIERQKGIVDGVDKILKEWQIEIKESEEKKFLSEFVDDSLYGISSKLKTAGKYPVLRMSNLDIMGNWHLDDLKYIDEPIADDRKMNKGDFIFNRTNSIELVGKSAVVNFDFSGTWAGYLIRLRLKKELSPYYLRYLFAQSKYKIYFSSIAKPSGGQANINAEQLLETKIDYCPPEIQKQIVAQLDKEMETLKRVRELKKQAEERIKKILEEVWGE